VAAQLESGNLIALAVTTPEPSPLAPGVPTVASAGFPGYAAVFQTGLFAPAGTPKAIIDRLNQEVIKVMAEPDFQKAVLNLGSEPVTSSPEELAQSMQADMAVMGKIINDVGIKLN
jgi:tripartite-type tricarboxylate transporter receptor subunit TctC